MEGKVVSTKLCFHLSLAHLAPTPCTHTSSRAHICTARARTCTYCTHTGFALILDCFGFCGGLIRLLFKLRAKPVCVFLSLAPWECVRGSVMMVSQSVVGIAQFGVLLLAPCSIGPILSPVFCLTPAFHYHLALCYHSALQRGQSHFYFSKAFYRLLHSCHTVCESYCVKDIGCNSSQNQVAHFSLIVYSGEHPVDRCTLEWWPFQGHNPGCDPYISPLSPLPHMKTNTYTLSLIVTPHHPTVSLIRCLPLQISAALVLTGSRWTWAAVTFEAAIRLTSQMVRMNERGAEWRVL